MVVELAVTGLSALVQPSFVLAIYWLAQSAATIFSAWGNGDRSQDENDFKNLLEEKQPKNYDFIVGKCVKSVISQIFTHIGRDFIDQVNF